jgi:hypothetical protein
MNTERRLRSGLLAPAALVALIALLTCTPRAQAAADDFGAPAALTNASGVDGDTEGNSVAISADGSTMVVGVSAANSLQGKAYVYTRGSNGWQSANEPAILSASDGADDDQFGHSVSVSQDGSVIAVGAPYANGGGDQDGQIYIFNRPNGGWTAQSTQTETTKAPGAANFEHLGTGVALSPDGMFLAGGLPGYSSSGPLTGQGGVYVWRYSGSALSLIGNQPLVAGNPGNEAALGVSVAMPSDNLIYAGAPFAPGNGGAGAVYGFSSESDSEALLSPWTNVSSAELSVGGSSNLFGWSVATGGGVVAAGAPDSSSDAGAVYLFRPTFHCQLGPEIGCFSSSSFTTPLATLTDPSGNGLLGESVAVPSDGAAVLAGAPGNAGTPPQPLGKAYVFGEPGSAWADASSPNATLQPSDPAAGDGFGAAAAISSDGGALAVGDPNSGSGEADAYEGRAGVAVGCQPGTDGVGEQTTCTATITDHGIGAGTPTGTVGFATDSAGTFSKNSCTLSSTVAGTSSCHVTYTPTTAGSGTHTLTASYSGDDEHAAASDQGTVAINRLSTITAVSCDPSPVPFGGTAECTATVTASAAGAGPPTGAISFKTNGPGTFGATSCTLPAATGVSATCRFTYTPSAIGPGTHQLTGDYSGDGGHAASQGSDPLGVAEASTNTAVSCAPLTVAPGKTTTCTATVTDAQSGGVPPTGHVAGKSTGAGTFSTCTLARLGSAGARCTFTYRPANADKPAPRLTLTYNGDANHFASSASVPLKVPASGSPTVRIRQLSVRGGRIVIKLSCAATEAYCKVGVAIAVGSRTLATGSVKVPGGGAKAVALAPKTAVLRGLRAGTHAARIALIAVDQSGHRQRESFKALLSAGKHFKLVIKK